MTSWILHHYPSSPYAEKARLMLGYKELAWGSVEVPMIPPRPHLLALLGGLRRIPVLQRGADFFCDTRLLPDVLDSVQPQPPLLPAQARPLSALIAHWVEPRVFVRMGPVRFETSDDLQPLAAANVDRGDFMRDRAPFMAPASDIRRSAAIRGSARDNVLTYLSVLESMLAHSAYLSGERPVASDFSAYHTVWWLRRPPSRDALLSRYPSLSAWADRMAAIGHGRPQPIDAQESLAQARAAQSEPPWQPDWPAVDDERLQRTMQLCPDDYGRDPVIGVVTAISDRHLTLTRDVPGVGTVRLHVPKANFELSAPDA
jgi:glutathione S-transferase